MLHMAFVVAAAFAAPSQQIDPPAIDTSIALMAARYDISARVDLAARRLDADARIIIVNGSDAAVRSAPFLLYRLMHVARVRDANGAPLRYRDGVIEFVDHPTLQVRQIVVDLPAPLAPHDSTTLDVGYGGYMLGYSESGWTYTHDRIDSAYSLLRMDTYAYPELRPPSHVLAGRIGLPTYDYHARITVPAGFVVANGGEALSRRDSAGWTTFEFRNLKPAWRMDFAVAPFVVRREGTLTVYQLPADSVGGERVMRSMRGGLALFTRWFGPLRRPTPFALIEIPDGWGSQADVTSILEAAAAFRDSLRMREVYHELSHLWNVVAADTPPPRWEEGLASFVEDLAVDSLDGRAVSDRNAQWLVGRLRERIAHDPRLSRVAPIDYGRQGMTDYSYSVGGLSFYLLYRVMGHDAFTRLIREYYATYADSGTTAQLIAMAERVSPVPIDGLFDDWFRTTHWTAIVVTEDAPALVNRYRAGPGQ